MVALAVKKMRYDRHGIGAVNKQQYSPLLQWSCSLHNESAAVSASTANCRPRFRCYASGTKRYSRIHNSWPRYLSYHAAGQTARVLIKNGTGRGDYLDDCPDDVVNYQVDGADAEMSSVIAPPTGCAADKCWNYGRAIFNGRKRAFTYFWWPTSLTVTLLLLKLLNDSEQHQDKRKLQLYCRADSIRCLITLM